MVADAVGAVPGVTAGVGVADGLFAAVLAAQCPGNDPVVVAAGGTAGFLAPWPLTTLGRPELADLLDRLGIRTLGRFAGLPDRDVLARFGVDGAACHRVAQGIEGELPGFRLSPRRSRPENAAQNATAKDRSGRPGAGGVSIRQPAFWGGGAGAAARAGRALARVQELLGPEAVVTGRLQGGRGPAERARVVTWCGGGGDEAEPVRAGRRRRGPGAPPDPPWPGRVPSPAPVIVLGRPLPVQLVDGEGHPVGVSGGGMVTAAPSRLSVDGGVWAPVAGWAGPWPSDERWWSVPRRQARMQVVTGVGIAHLLTRERGGWWLEATYD
jgi:protein ImuB